MDASNYPIIRQLFDDYLRMYAFRDDLLTTYFSEDFSGFTGGGDFLVKNREEWVAITRQDFAQVKEPIRIELKDLAIQSLADTVAVATGFFTIHLPIEDHILSRETARLVLIFHLESFGWKISHSSISIPYHLVGKGEIYPMKELVDRNQFLEKLVGERTTQLSEVNDHLQQTNEKLAREIAEHKQTEVALQNSLSLLAASLESTADGILIVDKQGKVARWNQKFAEMWRIPEEVLTLRDDEKIIHSILLQLAHPGEFIQNIGKIYEHSEQSTFDRIKFLDGRVFERYSQPQKVGDAIVGRVWSFRDITARIQAEEEKAKFEAVNRQFQKTESLSRMAGAIAHHFNNQLGGVLGNLEMALNDLPREAETFRLLAAAMGGARKAVEVSSLMLTYLGQTTGKHTPLDLSLICRQNMPLLRAAIPSEMLFTADLPSPGPFVSANANQIQQLLTNLITNAWEASRDNQGAIRLSINQVAAAEIPAYHRFPVDWQSSEVLFACLQVTDSGYGIAEAEIEKIFDPFYSCKSTGRGLGLPIVLGIVKAHSGIVTVQSVINRGSTFRVFLPLAGKEGPLQKEKAIRPAKKAGEVTILLVEDEEIVRNMAATMLKHLGYKVFLAKDGIEAVALFEQHKDKIHAVLSDLSMPRMNGWDTLSALRQIDPGIPVVLVSGHDESQVMAKDRPERPQVFLHKPYKIAELQDALTTALKGGC